MKYTDYTILGLQLPTDPRWVNLTAMSINDILTDHAYCEQKATSQCISLIQRYPQHASLINALTPLVTEEWGHFRMVLSEINKRKLILGPQRKDEYVNQLMLFEKKGGKPEDRLLDQLLMFALIEARSCERFKLLSEQLEDNYLQKFYKKFMISEAGHYHLFISLAKEYIEKEKVEKRWEQWLIYEKNVMLTMNVRGDRIH